ncbi:MAG: GAF domain-containing protein [Candidatus Eisenbacteria bacterium]|uniref:GAF domain-containing protein n=1 Tax=Eiseniibacteriota bacterium TaxID=2212470 RepID=A0A7Y2EAI8_UNCEI|nr:GAF domain-containing protein [Candidatus Eisenbacteria bacterium]
MKQVPVPEGEAIRVGFIELPDPALDLLTHFHQRDDASVVAVVGLIPHSYVLRMAEILQVPTTETPNRPTLSDCNVVIVGDRPAELHEQMTTLLGGMKCTVITVEEACEWTGVTLDEDDIEVSDSTNLDMEDLSAVFAAEEARKKAKKIQAEKKMAKALGEAEEDATAEPELAEVEDQDPVSEKETPVEDAPAEEVSESESDATEKEAAPSAKEVSADEPSVTEEKEEGSSVVSEELRSQVKTLMNQGAGSDALSSILDDAISLTDSKTGSIMVLEEGSEFLRIVAAKGLPGHIIKQVRQSIHQGVSGDVFRSGEPRLVDGRDGRPLGNSRELRPKLRQSAVVPIVYDGKTHGVLCVNHESHGLGLDEVALGVLNEFAQETAEDIYNATRMKPSQTETRVDALMRSTERYMALDESLPHRLKAVAESIRKTLHGDFAHLFLIDSLGQKLEPITPRRGSTISRGESVSLHQGMYGWAVRHLKPRVLVLKDEDSENGEINGIASYLIPIYAGPPRGLLVVEGVKLTVDSDPEELLPALGDVMERVAEMIEVEKGLEAQELMSQLQMRTADQSARFRDLEPLDCARAVLEFSVDLLAAETAVWVPHDSEPVWARPTGSRAASVQQTFTDRVDPIYEWAKDRDSGAGGAEFPDWDSDAPEAKAPYLTLQTPGDTGIYVLVFSPDDQAGALSQVPLPILFNLMRQLAGFLPKEMDKAA